MKKVIFDKIEQSVAIIAMPIAGVVGVWNETIDTAVYVEAFSGLLCAVCECCKLFCKE